MGRSTDILTQNLLATYTAATTTIKETLSAESKTLVDLAVSVKAIAEFIKEIDTRDKTFKKYALSAFAIAFFFQWLVIGALLWKLNIIGGDVIKSLAASALGAVGP